MPTEIEQGYTDQGYRLPEGLTWERVDVLRQHWGVNPFWCPRRSAAAASAGACRTSTDGH